MSALVLPNRRVEDWKYSDLRNAIDPAAVESAPTAEWRVDVSGAVERNALPEIMPRGAHGAMAETAIAHAKSGVFLRVENRPKQQVKLRNSALEFPTLMALPVLRCHQTGKYLETARCDGEIVIAGPKRLTAAFDGAQSSPLAGS